MLLFKEFQQKYQLYILGFDTASAYPTSSDLYLLLPRMSLSHPVISELGG